MSRSVRLYCPELHTGTVTLRGPECHHASKVLRLSRGDRVELFDGAGRQATGKVEGFRRDCMTVAVSTVRIQRPGETRIVLATAIPKHSAQQSLVFQGTELGIDAFWPMICERSAIRRFSTDKWLRWAIEACKQSGRNRLPEISQPISLPRALAEAGKFDLKIFGATYSDNTSPQLVEDWRDAIIYVGPEGGFTAQEVILMESHGVLPVTVGRFVLRIETAATALAATIIHARCG